MGENGERGRSCLVKLKIKKQFRKAKKKKSCFRETICFASPSGGEVVGEHDAGRGTVDAAFLAEFLS